jgi:two-component system, OmpR family, sensor histidine kinase KdpD
MLTRGKNARERRRKTPEELLREAMADEASHARTGHLKVVLGYASGVGKSFRMLDEARRRAERGQDVVVGAIQPRVPPPAEELLRKLEVIPLKQVGECTAIDVATIARRNPSVCFIDGLAYDNPPGLKNHARWQDVQELVSAGIKVIGSINIQYIEELREQVEAITGKHVTQSVPLAFIRSADEIEIVDAPPEESLERSPEEQVAADRKQERLTHLRELALVLAADVVDHQLSDYLERHNIQHNLGPQERIMVCITPRANAREMLETGRLIAQKFHAEIMAVYVRQSGLSVSDEAAVKNKLAEAQAACAALEIIDGSDPAAALLDFARSRGITQIFIGHTQRSGKWFGKDTVDKLIDGSQGMDVRIFPQ